MVLSHIAPQSRIHIFNIKKKKVSNTPVDSLSTSCPVISPHRPDITARSYISRKNFTGWVIISESFFLQKNVRGFTAVAVKNPGPRIATFQIRESDAFAGGEDAGRITLIETRNSICRLASCQVY